MNDYCLYAHTQSGVYNVQTLAHLLSHLIISLTHILQMKNLTQEVIWLGSPNCSTTAPEFQTLASLTFPPPADTWHFYPTNDA